MTSTPLRQQPAMADMVQGRLRYVWLWSLVWLLYLLDPIRQSWQNPDLSRRVIGLTAVAVFGGVFIACFVSARAIRRRNEPIPVLLRWPPLVVLLALVAAAVPGAGENALGMLTYVAVAAFFLLPPRFAIFVVVGLMVAAVVLPEVVPGWVAAPFLAFQIGVSAFAMWGIVQIVDRNAELAAAREELARLAVADERSRFARDLHDILGHSLTVVAVKAELAGRLVRLAPERAEEEIGDVERLARQALSDVRTAVSGYRAVTLPGELAGARLALNAAGIEPELPTAVDDVPSDRRELFGWVIREGVTNVVRHSGAKRCRVRLTPHEVEITDDGRGPGSATPDGHGLQGLQERVTTAGGTLSVGRSPEGGFALRARLP